MNSSGSVVADVQESNHVFDEPSHVLLAEDRDRWTKVAEFIQQHGRYFEAVPWNTWKGRRYRPMKKQLCFYNAWKYALRSQDTNNHSYPDKLEYVEGFALTNHGWAHHCWCVDETGRVVDPTYIDEAEAYFGIPLDLRFVIGLQEEIDSGQVFAVTSRPELHDRIAAQLESTERGYVIS
jgi:hypothetical protein